MLIEFKQTLPEVIDSETTISDIDQTTTKEASEQNYNLYINIFRPPYVTANSAQFLNVVITKTHWCLWSSCQFLIASAVIKHCIKEIFPAVNEFNLPSCMEFDLTRQTCAGLIKLWVCEMLNEFIALVSNLITSILFGIKFNISGKSEKWLASLTTNCRGIQLSCNTAHPCLSFWDLQDIYIF